MSDTPTPEMDEAELWAQAGLSVPTFRAACYQEKCWHCGTLFWGRKDSPLCNSCVEKKVSGTMSDTPRTDAAIIERRHIHKLCGCVELLELVDADVARKLERESNQRKADWNKACDQQGFLMLECDGHRAKAAKLREALQSVMDWNPKPEYWERPETVARFEADMAKARKVLEETE